MNTQPLNFIGEFPQLFSGLGKLETKYQIKRNPDVKPVYLYTPREIPHPLMPKLKNELDSMLRQRLLLSPQSGALALSLSQSLMGVYGSVWTSDAIEKSGAVSNSSHEFY